MKTMKTNMITMLFIRKDNLKIGGAPKEKGKKSESLFKEMMTPNFPNLEKVIG